MRSLIAVPVVLALALLVPAPASAVTVTEIISLSRAGISEQVILALIDRDQTIFTLPAEQLVTLQKAGVSDAILIAMLKSGREQPPVVAQVEAPPPPQETEPNIVGPGFEPNQFNGGQNNAAPAVAAPYAVTYFVPVPYLVPSPAARPRCVVRTTESSAGGSAPTGTFFLHPTHGQFFPNPPSASVVDCAPAGPRQAPRR